MRWVFKYRSMRTGIQYVIIIGIHPGGEPYVYHYADFALTCLPKLLP